MAEAKTGIDERTHRTRLVRENYRRFVAERIGRPKRSWIKVVIGLVLLATVVLIPVGFYLIVSGLRKQAPLQKQFQEEMAFIDRAEAVMAYPLMVNSMLRSPGDVPAPGLVIISFDRGEPETIPYMADVAIKAGEAIGHGLPPDDEQFLIDLMLDEEYQRSRRRRLPDSVTRGHRVYACDLSIHPWYLPGKRLNDEAPFIPCLAEPGEAGQIRAVPWWCVYPDYQPPPWASECPVLIA
jgi:hypothetical protein